MDISWTAAGVAWLLKWLGFCLDSPGFKCQQEQEFPLLRKSTDRLCDLPKLLFNDYQSSVTGG